MLPQTPQETGPLPPSQPPQAPGHFLGGQSHQTGCIFSPSSMPSVEFLFMKAQLRWTGHAMRMEDSRLPKQIFYSELAHGTRRQGGQTKRYKDSPKNSVRACDIPVKGWEHLAVDGSAWRLATHNGAQAFEERRLSPLDIKRQARKERKAKPGKSGRPSQERAEGQASCCRCLPGVWTHLRIGVWSAVTPEAPLTSSSL